MRVGYRIAAKIEQFHFGILTNMTEGYNSKLIRRLRVRSGFPQELQDVALRYVDQIAALDPDQLELLVQAKRTGLKSMRIAIDRLRENNPDLTLELLLKGNKLTKHDEQSLQNEKDITTLMDILEDCFHMPTETARALAESPVMKEALDFVKSLRVALSSQNINSDFVIISLYASLKYALYTLETKIKSNPTFVQTVGRTGLSLEANTQ